jgi:hypothetical protein
MCHVRFALQAQRAWRIAEEADLDAGRWSEWARTERGLTADAPSTDGGAGVHPSTSTCYVSLLKVWGDFLATSGDEGAGRPRERRSCAGAGRFGMRPLL